MKNQAPPFLKKGGGNKIARGEEPSGAKSAKLPFPKFDKAKKTGVPIKKGDKN